jgi:hypothetical protein
MNKDNRRGLGEVRVSKPELIAKMTGNLAIHQAEYAEALAGWQKKFFAAIQALEEARTHLSVEECELRLKDLNKLTKPTSHENEYIETLDLLEASRDDEFVLDVNSFNQYWRDNWRWSDNFSTSNARYK